jgi:hypothetical protein
VFHQYQGAIWRSVPYALFEAARERLFANEVPREAGSRFERLAEVARNLEIVSLILEKAERGNQVDRRIEHARTDKVAHIRAQEVDLHFFTLCALARMREERCSEVNGRDCVS